MTLYLEARTTEQTFPRERNSDQAIKRNVPLPFGFYDRGESSDNVRLITSFVFDAESTVENREVKGNWTIL